MSGDGRIHLASPCHVYGAAAMTADDAAWFAGHVDYATGGPRTFGDQMPALVAAGVRLGQYTKTCALSSGTALPESGYAHGVGGARKYDQTWHVYTAQPDSASWRAYHERTLAGLASWASCVFSDSVQLSYSQGGKPAIPPAYAKAYTLAEWLALQAANLDRWAALTGKEFLINGLGAAAANVLTPGVGMIENAYGSNSGALPQPARWLSTSQFLVDAQADGWTPWVYVKLFTQDAAAWDAWRKLIAPTMLLVDDGRLLYEQGGKEGSAPPWVTREYDHPVYQPDIGVPLEPPPALAADRLNWRRYTGGLVVVNPTTAPLVADWLPGFTVAPQSGLVLRRRDVYDVVA